MFRTLVLLLACLAPGVATAQVAGGKMERVEVSADGRGFVLAQSKRPFVPWGLNYDHNETGRLLEDYWVAEWPKVEEDFGEMKSLGANLVRIHLQLGKFMKGPDEPNEASLRQLARLIALAEKTRLYLDLTGLGCYEKKDVPPWYDALSEADRWKVQARFWEAVAARSASSPAVFCYDLMNEPVVPGGKREAGDWLGPPFGDKCFVQFITLDQAGRARPAVAREWVRTLVAAIRKHGRPLVTVGLVPWSLDRPGLSSGFVPKEVVGDLDFLSVHVYPESSRIDEAVETVKGFRVGKPVLIEEMFPLRCSAAELGQFTDRSQGLAAGWVGFYWGKTPEQCRRGKTVADGMTLSWLELFERRAKTLGGPSP